MKKLLIGCGCLVLLLLGAGGWFVWQFVPAVTAIQDSMVSATTQLNELDQQHPFDEEAQVELDTQRFAQALDIRVGLKDDFARWEADLESIDDEDVGFGNFIETMTGAMTRFADMFELLPNALEGQGMGPTEFIFHSRVLWAALDSIGAGAGGPELDGLRGEYDTMVGAYGQIRQQNPELPPTFGELVGEVPPALVISARQVLAADALRVEAALAQPQMEVTLLGLPEIMADALQEFDVEGVSVEIDSANGTEDPR